MRKFVPAIIVAGLFAGFGFALSLTDLGLQHEGKTGLKDMCAVINANNALLEALSGADLVTGSVAVARITNAAASIGPSIGGSIPVAAITNAAASIGPSIGGSIPVAAITNAAASVGPSIGGNISNTAITNALAALKAAGYPWTTNSIAGLSNIVFNAYGQFIALQP